VQGNRIKSELICKTYCHPCAPGGWIFRLQVTNQIDQLHSQVAALDKSKFTFSTAKFDGHYSQSDLQLFMNLFDLQKSALNKELEKIYSQLSDYDNNIAANSSQFFTLLEYAEIEELTPTMFEEMVDRVYCYDGKVDIRLSKRIGAVVEQKPFE